MKQMYLRQTIALDFDGVIHRYSKGWQDGEIYDIPMEGALEGIKKLMETYAVFILSTRSPWQIKAWLDRYLWMWDSFSQETELYLGIPVYIEKTFFYGYDSEVIWKPWVKFWNKKGVLGITNKKLPALVYIDDRAVRFTDWKDPEIFVKDITKK